MTFMYMTVDGRIPVLNISHPVCNVLYLMPEKGVKTFDMITKVRHKIPSDMDSLVMIIAILGV